MYTPAAYSTCSMEKKACLGWVEKYFKDCVCSVKGEISFGLGLTSLICWGVAEIPQIITNFQTKSGHGVSLGFLFTWVLGDIFNIVGCLLEPATLPTQLYTALLYTTATVVLVLQTLYYDYLIRWWKCRVWKAVGLLGEEDGEGKDLNSKPTDPGLMPMPTTTTPLLAAAPPPPRTDVYYMSARSLASSETPPFCSYSYLSAAGSGPADVTLHGSSSEDESYLASYQRPSTRANMAISPLAGYGSFIASSASLPFQSKALMDGQLILSGRKLLQDPGMKNSSLGIWLGWVMAAIYMGGRLPQIFLNIKRRSVEGLNPLMFLFALIANATYVGSILVRSVEWGRIKGNAPWLLDAIVCVLLDLFRPSGPRTRREERAHMYAKYQMREKSLSRDHPMKQQIILQFAYYKSILRRRTNNLEGNYGEYVEVYKPVQA